MNPTNVHGLAPNPPWVVLSLAVAYVVLVVVAILAFSSPRNRPAITTIGLTMFVIVMMAVSGSVLSEGGGVLFAVSAFLVPISLFAPSLISTSRREDTKRGPSAMSMLALSATGAVLCVLLAAVATFNSPVSDSDSASLTGPSRPDVPWHVVLPCTIGALAFAAIACALAVSPLPRRSIAAACGFITCLAVAGYIAGLASDSSTPGQNGDLVAGAYWFFIACMAIGVYAEARTAVASDPLRTLGKK